MKDKEDDKLFDDIDEVRAVIARSSRNVKWTAFTSFVVGLLLSFLFRHISTSSHFIAAIGLYSQIIAFGAAVLLSSQFMAIPERLFGIHNHAAALVMSFPIYVWLATFVYKFVCLFFDFPSSDVWSLVTNIACWGLGLALFAFGSIKDVIAPNLSDKLLVVAVGWYMVLFALGLQIYLSLISLEVLSVPFGK
ncbi:hypothetical protein [Salinivibrio sp. ES.052]|uniref:hypothetical protein n=1 Tax=Salinivibrio sp. ES.052 TaxID=1882823 RepID=UPI0009267268|nr:hypothetical protein [Salinivibrio sp. ES.052]SIN91918.1 hypothetical protein SAMN05444724_1211 [Salinivibrio sp. ES.052]